MKKPRLNLMIMRAGQIDQAVRSYSLPGYLPRLAIAGGAVLSLLFLTAVAGVIHCWRQDKNAASLRAENELLRESVARVTGLESELEHHREFTRRVAGLIGVTIPGLDDSLAFAGLTATEYRGGADKPDTLGPLTKTPSIDAPATGALVVNCAPDPNNRPRGLPLLGRLSRGFLPASANPALRHHGIDIAARTGSPVFAPAAGTVSFAGQDDIFGRMIVLDHGDGFETVYGHNSELLVKPGERVKRAQIIALSGNTGLSTAPHLHYEIRRGGNSIDPAGFLGR